MKPKNQMTVWYGKSLPEELVYRMSDVHSLLDEYEKELARVERVMRRAIARFAELRKDRCRFKSTAPYEESYFEKWLKVERRNRLKAAGI